MAIERQIQKNMKAEEEKKLKEAGLIDDDEKEGKKKKKKKGSKSEKWCLLSIDAGQWLLMVNLIRKGKEGEAAAFGWAVREEAPSVW